MTALAPLPAACIRNAERCALLVEDDPMLRSVIRRYLARRGWTVLEADSAEDALALVEDRSVRMDVVVADLYLPGICGISLFRRIVASRPRLAGRFLVASGDPMAAAERLTAESLHCPVLAKPYELEVLARALDELVSPR